MTDHSTATPTKRAVLPWLVALLAIVLAAGNFIWANQKIAMLQAPPNAPRATTADEDTRQAVAGLQQTAQEIQSAQKQLNEQVSEAQRKLAAESGERKLMSEQLSALSSRVNALGAANAATSAGPQGAKGRRGNR